MIKSIKFRKTYDLYLEKESQRRFETKTIKPTEHSREKKPYEVFYLFKKGFEIKFKPDINIIVGDNGTGKTTLFSLAKDYVGNKPDNMVLLFGDYENEVDYFSKYRDEYKGCLVIDGDIHYNNSLFFSAEHDNPVHAIPKMADPMKSNFNALACELFFAQEESHGESMLPILKYILGNAKNMCLFFDEPETALSLKNQVWLARELIKSANENNNQIFVSTHALALINMFNEIYDMETRKWVNREKYVKNILTT